MASEMRRIYLRNGINSKFLDIYPDRQAAWTRQLNCCDNKDKDKENSPRVNNVNNDHSSFEIQKQMCPLFDNINLFKI